MCATIIPIFADKYRFEDLVSETVSFGSGFGAEKARHNRPVSWRQNFGNVGAHEGLGFQYFSGVL